MRIAICEGNPLLKRQLHSYIEVCLNKLDRRATIDQYDNGAIVLEESQRLHHNVYIIGISLPGVSGLKLAEALRASGSKSPIVFLAFSDEYMQKAYQLFGSIYLVHPISEYSLEKALHTCFDWQPLIDPHIVVYHKWETRKILYRDITFIQSVHRICDIHTVNREIFEPYYKMDDLIQELADTRFLRLCKSYTVNLEHILAVSSKGIVLENNEVVPVIRGHVREVQRLHSLFEAAQRIYYP